MLFFLTGPMKFRHWFIGEGTPLARITDGLPLAAQVVCERTTLFVKEIKNWYACARVLFCTHIHTVHEHETHHEHEMHTQYTWTLKYTCVHNILVVLALYLVVTSYRYS